MTDPTRDPTARPAGTPDDVVMTSEARAPETDPILGIEIGPRPRGPLPRHRLVVLGDSLAQGFQNLAVGDTSCSWPALIAQRLGRPDRSGIVFNHPSYAGYGGLPFNLEVCIRRLEDEFGSLESREALAATVWMLRWARAVARWWSHEADNTWVGPTGPMHNLSAYSYDVHTAYTRTKAEVDEAVANATREWLGLKTSRDIDRSARRVFINAEPDMTLVDIAEVHGDDGGIETLVVELGTNNALEAAITLEYRWATESAHRAGATLWSPTLFASDWAGLIERIRRIDARHVLVVTVPHVTIAPVMTPVGDRLDPASRYFEWYTRPWLRERFDDQRDPCLSGQQARAIDSAIDAYNDVIVASVAAARADGLDWYVVDICGVLDRLASTRYLSDVSARPSWWDAAGGAYPLPDALAALVPTPTTDFFSATASGRTTGGLFSLDGVHPTTIGYGLFAQEVISVMHRAGVDFGPLDPVVEPDGPSIDFASLVRRDSLISDPPATIAGDFELIGWINEQIDLVRHLLGDR